MKKILLINGSPKGKRSNTIKLAYAFLKGLNKNNEYKVDEIICSQVNVSECKGCFGCWKNEGGQCVISDEMDSILHKYISANIVIWSFPTYFYGIPSKAKCMMDRLFPLYAQELRCDDGKTTYHPYRFNLEEQRYILFCSCAYYNKVHNVEAIEKQFELLYGNKCDMLFCSEGELLSSRFMDYATEEYLKALQAEGENYKDCFELSKDIKQKFAVPFLPMGAFLDFVEASAVRKAPEQTQEAYENARITAFFKRLALTYDAKRLDVEASVLEIQLVDYHYRCQLYMDKHKCEIIENVDHFFPYRLKVVCKLAFFTANQFLAGAGKSKVKSPDFNNLIDLINKFEKKGIIKEMKFC